MPQGKCIGGPFDGERTVAERGRVTISTFAENKVHVYIWMGSETSSGCCEHIAVGEHWCYQGVVEEIAKPKAEAQE